MSNPIFHIAQAGDSIGDSASKPFWATISALVKTNEELETCIANEYIAGGLGRFLGLPLAPGAIVHINPKSATYGYATLSFSLATEALPDVDAERLVEFMPREATGVVLFDILIANPDRHSSNLSALLTSPRKKLMVFDHGHALLGWDRSTSLRRLTNLRSRLGITGGDVSKQHRHCLLDQLNDASLFDDWIDRIRSIPNHFIEDMCRDMRDGNFMQDSESTKLSQFLRYRRDSIRDIISSHRHEFRGILQWGLDFWKPL